jgi:hypothetical protein
MGIFRRKDETLNEILLREADLDEPAQPPEPAPVSDAPDTDTDSDPDPFDPFAGTYPADTWTGALTRAMARPARYDSISTVTAPGLAGDRIEFATLPDGDVIVDEEEGDADLSPLADAVEQRLRPPYRVLARREDGDLWAVAARQIEVVRLDFDGGDGIELSSEGGRRELRVDGEPWQGEIPGLEQAGEVFAHDYVVQADRLDGDLWEIQASAL